MHDTFENVASYALPLLKKHEVEAADIIRAGLNSPPMQSVRYVLDRSGLRVDPRPIVYKDLSDSLVRLMFPVTGGPIEDGSVVSVVCLFDRREARTLYAHPMHAGPGVNPLVLHLGGPMAAPKSQSGDDGDRASRRIVEHKKAIWDRFLQERARLGEREAGRRWRVGYYWALQRLYFCSGCSACKWGSPFFDGPDPRRLRRAIVATSPPPATMLRDAHATIVGDIVSSREWQTEIAYAHRGGFAVASVPLLIKKLGGDFVQVVFPTNASILQGGSLVAVSFVYYASSRRVVFSHCLCAGPESEIQFLKGDVAFGLPRPQPGTVGADAIIAYQSWRRRAWSQFWLDDLENGPAAASEAWLASFWTALKRLFAANEICEYAGHVTSDERADPSGVSDAGRWVPRLPHQALENIGGRCFAGHSTNRKPTALRALGLSTLMVNLGWRCNQACNHCHVDAGPDRTEEMTLETVNDVLRAVRCFDIETLDITGGAPELNPHFRYLAREASQMGCRVVDRCNLTVFFEPGLEDLPEFLAENGINVTASLPSDRADVADAQRGAGTFAKSIAALKKLNALGYARRGTGLVLNLVFNPTGTELGGSQEALERRFKRELFECFGIEFNRLFVMNNMPIHRFEHFLKRSGQWSKYMKQLVGTFNPDATDGMMCRRTLSVGYDGRLYDCDFNQVIGRSLTHGLPDHIRDIDVAILSRREINTAGHCFGCAAGAGSSCNGALVELSYKGESNPSHSGYARTPSEVNA